MNKKETNNPKEVIRQNYEARKMNNSGNSKKNKLIEYAKKCNNLLISPHMAGLTEESEKKAFLISVENIIKYFKK